MIAKHDPQSARKVVLIVDDDLQVLKMTSRLLALAGYHTVGASTPVEALGIATQIRLDILLVDAVLPGMSGPDLVEELSKLQVFEKTVLMSGLDSLAVWMAYGKPCQVLQKPFSSDELIRKIRMAGVMATAG